MLLQSAEPSGVSETLTMNWMVLGTAPDQQTCEIGVFPGSEFLGLDQCATTFLVAARDVGDPTLVKTVNILCEDTEACVRTLNIASFQGEGALQGLGPQTVGSRTFDLSAFTDVAVP